MGVDRVSELFENIEIRRCSNDPIYFLRKYGKIRHPMHGKIQFELFPYQEKALREFELHRKSIVLKSRQLGFSWLAAGYALWKALFRIEADILLMSKKEDDAKEILHKVKFIFQHLPKFLKLKTEINSAQAIGFGNGSRVMSLPATEDSGRGFSGNLVIIDEAAFIPWGELVFGALRPTLSTGGSIILQSTAPNEGGENLFTRLYFDHSENGFHRIVGENKESSKKGMIHWSENPERDEFWYEEERPGYTDRQWATEMEGSFEQSSRRVFPEQILKLHKEEDVFVPGEGLVKKKIEWKVGEYGEEYCEEPIEGEQYAAGFDPAEGLAKGDYCVLQILKKRTGKQVCRYRSRIPLIEASEVAVSLARKYNNALLGIEDNNVGIVSINIAKKKYKNLYRRKVHDKKSDTFTEKLGWRSTKRSKPLLVRDLELALRDKEVLLTDEVTRRELWQYEYDDKGSTNAPKGDYFDDCVMSLGVAVQCLKQLPSAEAQIKLREVKERRKRKINKNVRNSTIGY